MQRKHVPGQEQKKSASSTAGKQGRSFSAPNARAVQNNVSFPAPAQAKSEDPIQGVFGWVVDLYNYLTTTPPLDRNNLADVASTFGITEDQLRNHLESGALNDQTYDSATATNALPGAGIAKGLIPPSLTRNYGPLKGVAKLQAIFNRVNNFPFHYSGNYTNGYNGFLKKAGDCQTLVQMFVLAAEAAGIPGVEIKDKQLPMLVKAAPIHGRALQGNVRDNTYWSFHEHYWAVYEGKYFDLLFMDNKTPTTFYFKQNKSYSNVNYQLYDAGRCMITAAELQAKLNIVLPAGELGIVRNKEEEIKSYIRNPN